MTLFIPSTQVKAVDTRVRVSLQPPLSPLPGSSYLK